MPLNEVSIERLDITEYPLLFKCQGRSEVCGIRNQRDGPDSGIRRVGSGITASGSGITSHGI